MNVSLILIILLIGALATYSVGDKFASKVALLFGLVSLGASIVLLNHYNLGENIGFITQWIAKPNISFALQADGLALAMLLLTTALTPIIIFSSFGTEVKNAKTFYALILFMAFAMAGTFLATDGLLYYIFWELSLLPIYFIALVWGNGDSEERKKAVVKFFIYTLAGSLFMLVGFAYLYQKAGSLLIEDLYKLDLSGVEQVWLFVGFFLAYAIKIPIIPFHTWQAETYTKAPTAGTMLLSAIMLKMALFGLLKWVLPIFDGVATDFWRWPIITLGIIGVVYGAVVAIRQQDLKTLFAYASLSHLGLIAAALMLNNFDTNQIAVVQIVNHSIVSIGLFLAAGIIEQRLGTRELGQLGGIAKVAPRFAFWFAVLTFVSLSVPFTAGFIGEFFLIKALFSANAFTGFLASTTLVLGAVYMLKAYQAPMFGPTINATFEDLHWSEIAVFAILSIAAIYLGLAPQCLTDFVAHSLPQPTH